MATTFRADVRAGLLTLLQGFATANPTMLRSTLSARPEGFTGDYPIGFVERQPEVVFHTQGIRDRTMSPAVSIVAEKTLNAQEQAAFDLIVDAFVDYCTDRPHIVTGTIWDRMIVEDYLETIGEQVRPAVRVTFTNLSIQEGRTT